MPSYASRAGSPTITPPSRPRYWSSDPKPPPPFPVWARPRSGGDPGRYPSYLADKPPAKPSQPVRRGAPGAPWDTAQADTLRLGILIGVGLGGVWGVLLGAIIGTIRPLF